MIEYKYFDCGAIEFTEKDWNYLLEHLDSREKDNMIKKKPSTTRIKKNPGNNAVGSTTVQYSLACGCKMEQRLDYKNTTTKRFRKTLLAKIYPEQPSQKDTQVTGTSFLTLVADPKCLTHHPNPKNALTGFSYIPETVNYNAAGFLLHQNSRFKGVKALLKTLRLSNEQADELEQIIADRVRY